MADVHIVGAGPAGSFAAYTALKAGYDVALSEEHASIGQPVHCSGLVSASGLEQMKDVVPYKKIIRNPIYRANLHGQNSAVSLSFKSPKAFVIDRGAFDWLAAQKYVREGGKLSYGQKIRNISDLRSKNVIGADGPISTIARLFSFPQISDYSSCWQGEYKYKSDDVGAVEVFFDPALAPGFIGWCIPISEERAKIGLGVSRRAGLHSAKQKLLEKLKIKDAKPYDEFSALIPIEARGKTAISHDGYNVCLCGDSAGQVKASSGGGIFFGASCGRLAGLNFGNPYAYEQAWKSKFGMDLSLHRAMRMGLNSLPPIGVDAWIGMMKALRFDGMLIEAGEMDEYSKMISARTFMAWAKTFAKPNK